jgi:hypothetical protein
MKDKFGILKGFLWGIGVPICFFILTLVVGIIWYSLFKYLDVLLYLFSGNMFLTFSVFCVSIGLIIHGVLVYVSRC